MSSHSFHTDGKGNDACEEGAGRPVRRAVVDVDGGYGEKELVSDDTDANRQKNRRVEFVVQPE